MKTKIEKLILKYENKKNILENKKGYNYYSYKDIKLKIDEQINIFLEIIEDLKLFKVD